MGLIKKKMKNQMLYFYNIILFLTNYRNSIQLPRDKHKINCFTKFFTVKFLTNSQSYFFFLISFQTKFSEETYASIFNLFQDKQFFIFGLPIKISFSKLYLEVEKCLYIFNNVYSLDSYTIQYFKIFIMFIFIILLSNLLFWIAYFLSLNIIKQSEKLSQYECGFEPFDEATRHPFDVHFYIVGILFLIFDVEIALLFPWVYSLHLLNWFGFYTMIMFLIILTVGFFYEWHKGALAWPHQTILLTSRIKRI